MTTLTVFLRRSSIAIAGTAALLGCHRAGVPWPTLEPRTNAAFVLGEVRSSRGNYALAEANIRLRTTTGETVQEIKADNNGRFIFGPVPPGAYQVQVRMIAHRAFSQPAMLQAGAIDTMRLKLTWDSTGLTRDCISPDGKAMGEQYCRGVRVPNR